MNTAEQLKWVEVAPGVRFLEGNIDEFAAEKLMNERRQEAVKIRGGNRRSITRRTKKLSVEVMQAPKKGSK